ncbi:hypothetical protein [Burkholderia sp. Ac-20365]|uniref:hypothetical protein n=1 Tax=Burkholderia sp. Ac-20365 TaxID=2703897 RepID=UPI00197CB182|nr:hypothetical protein [Burkholderia sp. Ac-20365]MBN3760954.1 hypothetical protein [Burkholderia sp. Ac-20365]
MDSRLFFSQRPVTGAFTAVPARRLRIRQLQPGSSYLEFDGKDQRVARRGVPAEGVEFSLVQQLHYSFNLKRASFRFDPVTLLVALGRAFAGAPRALTRAVTASRGDIGNALRLIPKAIALAVVGVLCVAGLSRFVHIDVRAIAQSVHFALPHFLTPWKPVDSVDVQALPPVRQPMQASTDQPVSFTPAHPVDAAQQGAPGGASGAQPQSADPAYVPQYYRKGPGSYLPMPSGGPLPAGMASTYVPSTSAPVHLTVNEPFSAPESDDDQDSVQLMPTKVAEVKEVVVQPEHKERASAERDRAPADRKPDARASNEAHPTASSSHVAHPQEHPAPAAAPQPTSPRVQQPTRTSGDLVLLNQPSVGATAEPQAAGGDGEDDPSAPVNLVVRPAKRSTADDQAAPQGPSHPSYSVVTHTDDSVVVRVDGKMKQIPVGQSLPDGSKLLSVNPDGGGFTTSRGKFAAY